LVQLYLKDAHYTSQVQAGLNLTYSMINVALVGLPYVAYEAGLPIFIVVVVAFAVISIYTTTILIEMAEDRKVRSLEDLGEKAFGPRGYFTTCFLQILFSLLLICM
jgi:amino acid permease